MDKHTHIDSIRSNLGITLEEVSKYNGANRDEIENIETIFDLQGTNKEKVLALLYLLASGENNDAIQSYRSQTGLQETLYDSTGGSITKYNLMLVTALIYVPAFYTMAVNYYGAVSAGLAVRAVKEESAWKDIQDYYQYIFVCVFDPSSLVASLRGEPKRMTNDFNERITKYTDAFNANPNDYDTCMNLVFLYMQIGSGTEKAIEFSNKALGIRKGDPLALYARGLAYYKMGGRNQNALNDLQAVLEMNIQNKKAIYYVIGWIYIKEGEPQKAREAFEACRTIDPDFADVNDILEGL